MKPSWKRSKEKVWLNDQYRWKWGTEWDYRKNNEKSTAKSLAPSSLIPPIRHLYILVRSSWVFSSPGWTVPTLSASPCRTDTPVPPSSFWPFAGHCLVCLYLCYTGEPRTGPCTPDVSHQCCAQGNDQPHLDLLTMLIPKQPRILLPLFAARAQRWCMLLATITTLWASQFRQFSVHHGPVM